MKSTTQQSSPCATLTRKEALESAIADFRTVSERNNDATVYSTITSNIDLFRTLLFSDDEDGQNEIVGLAHRACGSMLKYLVSSEADYRLMECLVYRMKNSLSFIEDDIGPCCSCRKDALDSDISIMINDLRVEDDALRDPGRRHAPSESELCINNGNLSYASPCTGANSCRSLHAPASNPHRYSVTTVFDMVMKMRLKLHLIKDARRRAEMERAYLSGIFDILETLNSHKKNSSLSPTPRSVVVNTTRSNKAARRRIMTTDHLSGFPPPTIHDDKSSPTSSPDIHESRNSVESATIKRSTSLMGLKRTNHSAPNFLLPTTSEVPTNVPLLRGKDYSYPDRRSILARTNTVAQNSHQLARLLVSATSSFDAEASTRDASDLSYSREVLVLPEAAADTPSTATTGTNLRSSSYSLAATWHTSRPEMGRGGALVPDSRYNLVLCGGHSRASSSASTNCSSSLPPVHR